MTFRQVYDCLPKGVKDMAERYLRIQFEDGSSHTGWYTMTDAEIMADTQDGVEYIKDLTHTVVERKRETMTTKKLINNVTQFDVDYAAAEGTFKAYQRMATKNAIYPGQGTPLGLAYCALKLNGEAGELAEHVGKAMRDDGLVVPPSPEAKALGVVGIDGGGLTSARMALIVKEVGDVLWYLSAICNEVGCTLEDAAAINLRKLKDRSDRDALQGSGDER